jgi:ferredoxin
MLVRADRDRCVGTGNCAWTAPEVFGQDEEGMVAVLRAEPASGQARAVREAVDLCPVRAIVLDSDEP